jgi:outer membrane protein
MALPPTASPGRAETMSGALARAYAGNPDLNQQRARVRATDENLPRTSAAWRPTAAATGQFGYNYFDLSVPVSASAQGATVAAGAETDWPKAAI